MLLNAASGLVFLIQGAGGLIWILVGTYFRYRLSGMICGGDKNQPHVDIDGNHADGLLLKSAKFISTMVILGWTMFFIMTTALIVYLCKRPRKRILTESSETSL